MKQVLYQNNITLTLSVLGRGSVAHHAESAIRNVQNKARPTAHSLPYTLSGKWAPLRVRCTAGFALSSAPCSERDESLIGHDWRETRGLGHYGWCYSLEERSTRSIETIDGSPSDVTVETVNPLASYIWMWFRSAALNSTKTQKRHSKTLFF